MMKRNIRFLLPVLLLSCLGASAQKQTQSALNDLFGQVAADAVAADLKANHVHTVEKIMNKGDNVMSATFDAKGRVVRFQWQKGVVADSMEYNDRDQLTRYHMVSDDNDRSTVLSTIDYEYDKDDMPATYLTDHNRTRARRNYSSKERHSDTGIVFTYDETGEETTTKTYREDNVTYVHLRTTDKAGNDVQDRLLYLIADSVGKKSDRKVRVLERGEYNYTKGIQDTLPAIIEQMNNARSPKDTGLIRAMYTLGNAKRIGATERMLIAKYFPGLVRYKGRKNIQEKYEYKNAHSDEVVSYVSYGGTRHFEVSYNADRKVSEKTEITGQRRLTEEYTYNTTGLPASIKVKDAPDMDAVFKYSFYGR